MLPEMNEASRWRIDMARYLSGFYSCHEEVAMVCLGGSSARGVSDAYSDLDIIVYWNKLDEDWIRSSPLEHSLKLKRTDIISMAPGTFIESYHKNGLKMDFGHVTLKVWEESVTPLEADPDQMGMIGGFLASIPFYGEELFEQWKSRLSVYPSETAKEIIKKNLGFYVNGYLLHQCFERGDLLAYTDSMCSMLKKMISVTAALNRHFYSATEPRWIENELSGMNELPEKLTYANICWILSNPGQEAEAMLYTIQDDILSMVALQFPTLQEKVAHRRKRMARLAVSPCHSRPVL